MAVPRGISIPENHLLKAFLDRSGGNVTYRPDCWQQGQRDKNQYTSRELIHNEEISKWSQRTFTFANGQMERSW